MKSASFKYTANGRTIYGRVTKKNDGKVSVSLSDGKYFSAATRYQAKNLGLKIAEADFVHEAVISLEVQNTKGLIEKLTAETVELKESYIERTKEYARNSYDWALKLKAMTQAQLVEKYGEVDAKHATREFINGEWVRVIPKRLHPQGQKDLAEARSITCRPYEEYEAREVKYANIHYQNSIEKLASKLNRKGIKDDTEMVIRKSYVGVNINMEIEHDGSLTKAWTITAAMDSVLVRPHYRYLIK